MRSPIKSAECLNLAVSRTNVVTQCFAEILLDRATLKRVSPWPGIKSFKSRSYTDSNVVRDMKKVEDGAMGSILCY